MQAWPQNHLQNCYLHCQISWRSVSWLWMLLGTRTRSKAVASFAGQNKQSLTWALCHSYGIQTGTVRRHDKGGLQHTKELWCREKYVSGRDFCDEVWSWNAYLPCLHGGDTHPHDLGNITSRHPHRSVSNHSWQVKVTVPTPIKVNELRLKKLTYPLYRVSRLMWNPHTEFTKPLIDCWLIICIIQDVYFIVGLRGIFAA